MDDTTRLMQERLLVELRNARDRRNSESHEYYDLTDAITVIASIGTWSHSEALLNMDRLAYRAGRADPDIRASWLSLRSRWRELQDA